MELIVGPRQSGRTTELIKRSHDTGAVIVVATHQRAKSVEAFAKKLGIDIPKPMCVSTIIDNALGNYNYQKDIHVLIDDADDVLRYIFARCKIDAVTMLGKE